MIGLSKAPRVRLHFFDDATPSVEGLLRSRRHGEYIVDIPALIYPSDDESTNNEERVNLQASRVLVPREAISMVEVLS